MMDPYFQITLAVKFNGYYPYSSLPPQRVRKTLWRCIVHKQNASPFLRIGTLRAGDGSFEIAGFPPPFSWDMPSQG
jgi:hypothetical protein